MLRLHDSLNKLVLLHTPLTFHSSFRQNQLELLDPQFGNILLFHFFRLDGKLDGADFGIHLGNSLAQLERGHAGGKGLRDVSLDGIDVVTDLALAGIERLAGIGTVLSEGRFNGGLVAGIALAHARAHIVNDLDANYTSKKDAV